jgi:hypothetical protein
VLSKSSRQIRAVSVYIAVISAFALINIYLSYLGDSKVKGMRVKKFPNKENNEAFVFSLPPQTPSLNRYPSSQVLYPISSIVTRKPLKSIFEISGTANLFPELDTCLLLYLQYQ